MSVDLIYNYYNDLTGKQKEFKEMDAGAKELLKHWLNQHAMTLEEGFFYFSENDSDLTERNSVARSIMEY